MSNNIKFDFRCNNDTIRKWKLCAASYAYDNMSEFARDVPELLDKNKVIGQLQDLLKDMQKHKDPQWQLRKWQVLFYLHRYKCSELSLTELAHYMGVYPRSIAEDVTELLQKGFIKSIHGKKCTTYRLTVKGTQTANSIHFLYHLFNSREQNPCRDDSHLWDAMSVSEIYAGEVP